MGIQFCLFSGSILFPGNRSLPKTMKFYFLEYCCFYSISPIDIYTWSIYMCLNINSQLLCANSWRCYDVKTYPGPIPFHHFSVQRMVQLLVHYMGSNWLQLFLFKTKIIPCREIFASCFIFSFLTPSLSGSILGSFLFLNGNKTIWDKLNK